MLWGIATAQNFRIASPACIHRTLLQLALDMIGTRGGVKPGVTKEKRIKYARDILQKELLPHIGINEQCDTKKVKFLFISSREILTQFLAGLLLGIRGSPLVANRTPPPRARRPRPLRQQGVPFFLRW